MILQYVIISYLICTSESHDSSLVVSIATPCSENEIEIFYTKKTGNTTVSEVFYLHIPGTSQVVYTSPIPEPNSIISNAICVQKTDFDTYDLVPSTDVWHHNSTIEFLSPYGTITYKSSYFESTVSLVFYTPIRKNSMWYVLHGREQRWTDLDWEQQTLWILPADSIAGTFYSNHIFCRKVISGPSTTPAAYEVRVKYKHGVIVYVNGYKVLQDNLGDGFVKATAMNTKSYRSYDYRGAVRNGFEVYSSSFVVAVEVHASEIITEFDAWLTVYGSTWGKQMDIVYYYPVSELFIFDTLTADSSCDYNFHTLMGVSSGSPVEYFDFHIGMGQCNGFMYYVDSRYGKLTNVRLRGHSIEYDSWLSIMDRSIPVNYNSESFFTGSSLYPVNYDVIRLYIREASAFPIGFNEVRPIIRYLAFERNSPAIGDVLFEYVTGDRIQEELAPATDYRCESLDATPIGLSITERCVLSGSSTTPGVYTIDIVAVDYLGPQYFTLYLSILQVTEKVKEYDVSYRVAPIVFTVFFCVLVFVGSIIAITVLLAPVMKRRLVLRKVRRRYICLLCTLQIHSYL